MMSSVRVENLSKAQKKEAVHGLSFDIKSGELFCLLGEPGAGKTTVLRLIAGLERPDGGDIYLSGELVNNIPPGERDVAMVFEDAALYPHMTAYENIAYPLRLRRFRGQEIDRHVRELAENLHISHILDRRPQTFSGGELRRVAIGRALIRRPRVLLLDQPLTDLDAKIRQEMTGELKKLQEEVNQTMIYATHDFEEALTLADRIMVIDEGREEQLGPPGEIYDRPQTALVARLVGSPPMNIFSCQSKPADDQLILEHPGFRLTMSQITAGQLPAEMLVGIRPEHIVLRGDKGGISTTVGIVQPLGDLQIVDLSLPDGTVMKAVIGLDTELKSGDRIRVQFPPDKIALFDKVGNSRIDLEQGGSQWQT